jgi:DGQHR domain-containing protein
MSNNSSNSKKNKIKKFSCIPIKQGGYTLALLSISANELWNIVTINRREPDKQKGYQRVLSSIRVASVSRYIQDGNPIPTSILVAFDKAAILNKNTLSIPDKKDAGWVIDGQHRLAGAFESQKNIDLAVVAFLNISEEKQIEQFVKINKEAKNVPTSLYLDLLKHLPKGNDSDLAKIRATDIAHALRKDESSSFFGKITVLDSPKSGQLSLTNFVRKIHPLVYPKKGRFIAYPVNYQIAILNNYYEAFEHVFPNTFEPENGSSIFFKTLGFGALIGVLPFIFDLCLTHHKNFKTENIVKILKTIEDFDFEKWDKFGTGTEAEKVCSNELQDTLASRNVNDDLGDSGLLEL